MKRLLVALTVCLLVADNGHTQDAAKDLEKLQGTWEPVSGERMGKPLPDIKEHMVVIEKDTLAIKRGDRVLFKGKFRLDPTKKPGTLDLEITEGPPRYKAKVSQGIYTLEGGQLKWCNSEPGAGDRPRAFSTNSEKNHMHIVLKRSKQ